MSLSSLYSLAGNSLPRPVLYLPPIDLWVDEGNYKDSYPTRWNETRRNRRFTVTMRFLFFFISFFCFFSNLVF